VQKVENKKEKIYEKGNNRLKNRKKRGTEAKRTQDDETQTATERSM